ncbi:unnamed protein product (macronuclear) [Paramecium tetraurelia]|uniref:Uncharacterized protein n=1 Tax=Paramecium tetraurelia TaxID=5888 RepID=A0BP93_PARTE|nr:uncharacterized protein GSPATT00005109001 [Paramecium tetraurelia]CAK60360.1 unnamed protein product [Paramecium tetraurelia]|eukprot:XP_001427758.1 hypothetical protein (macronuclear) [Paramecium tetraurelia strain d4-2]
MRNSYLLLIIAITLVHVHGLEESLTLMSLEQMNSLDTSQFDCSRPQSEFIQMENSLSQWQDLLEHKDFIDHDIQVLQGIQAKVGLKASHKQVIKSLSQLKLPKTSTKIGLAEVEALKQQCGCLKNSDDNCDALLKLLSYFILSLRNVQSQCQQHPITVIKIKGKIHDLQVIRGGCGGTIDIKGDESCDTQQETKPDEPSTDPITKPTEEPATDPITKPTTDPIPDDQKDSEDFTEETTVDTTEETVDTQEETADTPEEDQEQPQPAEETTQPEEGEPAVDEKKPEEEEGGATEETQPGAAEEQEGSPEETQAEEAVDTPAVEEEAEHQVPEEEGTEQQTPSAEEGESPQEEVALAEEITEPEEEVEIQVPGEESEENPAPAEEVQADDAEEGQSESAEEGQAESAEEQTGPSEEGVAQATEEGEVEAPEETAAQAEEEELQIDEPTEEVDIEVPAEEEACAEEEWGWEEEEIEEEVSEEISEEETPQEKENQPAGESGEEQQGEEEQQQQQQPGGEETESGEPLEFEEEQQGEVPATEETAAPGEETATPGEETTTTDEETTDAEESSVGDEPVPDDQQDEEQEVLPEGCRKVPEDVLDISWQSTEAVAVSDLPVTETQIIGLSFYFRWLSKFPDAVPEGLSQETKFFVAGLGNALKFYVGQGGFHFSSFDENGVETYKNAGHGDIEGQWVLVYFGISNQKVTGFAQIQGQDVETVEFDVNLTLDESYQLVIGGPDGDVKSFNGQIARVFAFNDELYTQATEFTQFVTKCYGIPKNIYSGKRLTIPIEKERTFVSPASFDYDSVFENKKPMLPDEYSASGWFKWEKPNDQNIWHFRIQMDYQQSRDQSELQSSWRQRTFFLCWR